MSMSDQGLENGQQAETGISPSDSKSGGGSRAPRRMSVGDTVLRRADSRQYATSDERGVVVWFAGRGIDGRHALFADDLYVIRRSPGVHTVGNAVDEWEVVPEAERTTYERVLGASASYEPPGWPEPSEQDSYAFALLTALLPVAEQERVFGEHDWPTSEYELVETIARWLDDALPAERKLGMALGRIGGGDV